MATQYPNNLEITVEQPIDTRLSAKDIEELDSFKYLYPGLLTYLRSVKKFYCYDNGWKELSAGIKIVTSESKLDASAPKGSLAVVASADDTDDPILYIKKNKDGGWKKFNEDLENSIDILSEALNALTEGMEVPSIMGAINKAITEAINNVLTTEY